MIKTEILGRLPREVSVNFIQKITAQILHSIGKKEAVEIDISVINDVEMKRLNKQYRGQNKTTDVLSFSYLENADQFLKFLSEEKVSLLGEVVISIEQIHRQAKEKRCSVKDEFTLMLVHGILHLVGYDHITKRKEAEMFELQQKIMNQIKFK
jgi:probable rRNA maturation factor